VRELLAERQPALAAALRELDRQLEQELSRGADPEPAHHGGSGRAANTTWLYHPDSSACLDRWSCQEQHHTNIPPRCGARAAVHPTGCELPKGHPGPHLPAADRPQGVGEAKDGVGVGLLAADNRKGDRDRYPCRAG
jgi:hypothetical protein